MKKYWKNCPMNFEEFCVIILREILGNFDQIFAQFLRIFKKILMEVRDTFK